MTELTTAELASRLGITVDLLKKWKRKGDIPSGPKGRHGQGGGNQNMWSEQAQREAFARKAEARTVAYRKNKP